MVFEFTKKIYGYECDVYGHLNNANYLAVYEAARVEALLEMGMPIKKLLEKGYMLYLVKVELDYKKSIELEEIIKIKSRVIEHNRIKAVWDQRIYDSKGNLCNIGIITGVYVSNGKTTRIDGELCTFFDSFVDKDMSL